MKPIRTWRSTQSQCWAAAITIGLEANCNDLLGMLAELKYDVDGNARRVGLVFIDAHGDFNVPETTPSFNLYPDGVSRQSAFNLIEGAIRALQAR